MCPAAERWMSDVGEWPEYSDTGKDNSTHLLPWIPVRERRRCDSTPSEPHPVGGKESQTVSSGRRVGKYPPRKETPKSTHSRPRHGKGSPSGKHEFCDRTFTCPGRGLRGGPHASPSHTPLGPLPDGPPARRPPNSPRKPANHIPSPQGPRGQTLGRATKLLAPPYGRARSVDT